MYSVRHFAKQKRSNYGKLSQTTVDFTILMYTNTTLEAVEIHV